MSEHTEQAKVIRWAKNIENFYPALKNLFSTLNGIPLIGMSKVTRAKVINHMKREGMKKGVPDLILLAPSYDGQFHGLAIEAKVNDNKPTPEQIDWLDRLDAVGYRAVALWGSEEIKKTICDHLGIEERIINE